MPDRDHGVDDGLCRELHEDERDEDADVHVDVGRVVEGVGLDDEAAGLLRDLAQVEHGPDRHREDRKHHDDAEQVESWLTSPTIILWIAS